MDWDALERREIRAPIVPHVMAPDDTRYFARLALPPMEDIPGLVRPEPRTPESGTGVAFDVVGFQFGEF